MQQQLMRREGAEEELKEVKAQLSTTERQRDRVLDELKEIKERTNSNKEIQKVHDEGEENEDKAVLVEKIEVLKKELRQALEGEEYNKKALDDLAMALKEVTNESIPTKEQLKETERELEVAREEAENLKTLVKCTEKTCEAILSESAKESDRLKNTVDRLKLEAKESVLAWNEKEEEFVMCIKKVEAENGIILEEKKKLGQSMREDEGTSSNSMVENRKLRDILKKALNKSNVGKEVANLAKDEAYNLQDLLKEKDGANERLAQETERLRINEAEANGSVKGLKLALTMGSKRETHDEAARERKMTSSFSFDPKQLLYGRSSKPSMEVDEGLEKDDALGESNSHYRRISS